MQFTICIKSFGANGRNRTVDLLITNELLYQLSYTGLVKKLYQSSQRGHFGLRYAPFFVIVADLRNCASNALRVKGL